MLAMYPAATPASTVPQAVPSTESERHDLGLVAEFGKENDAERSEEGRHDRITIRTDGTRETTVARVE